MGRSLPPLTMTVPLCYVHKRCNVYSSTEISSTAHFIDSQLIDRAISGHLINALSLKAHFIDSDRCQLIDRHFHQQPTGATGGSWIFYIECYCLARLS
jgi:hypothetical protein